MSVNTSDLLIHQDASRTLALGGILLILTGLLLGEVYAIYISHVANGFIKQSWTNIIEATGRGDTTAIKEYFAIVYDLTEKRGRFMNTHSHVGSFGLLALVLAIIQPVLSLSNQAKNKLASGYMLGAILQVGCVYLSYYVGTWVLYLSDIGALLVIIVVAISLKAFFNQGSEQIPSLDELVRTLLRPAASRLLLKAGILLILAGMVFGLYHAWRIVTVEENAIYTAFDAAVDMVNRGDIESAKGFIADFKRQQSKVAITSAAHSHAVEFGFLMILLAFIQSYVFLQKPWCLRWARVVTAGAFILPVSVFLATMYGLRAAAVADLSGGLVTIGLFAMSIGIIRYTGVADLQADEVP